MPNRSGNETTAPDGDNVLMMSGTPRRFAIIEALRSEGGRERFAVAYLNERALRMVIATACIIATDFLSREEALRACAAPVALAG